MNAFVDLVARLPESFPEGSWHATSTRVVFPAESEPFGDIEVEAADDELIVHFGRFTHAHFDSDEQVASLLTKVFADEVEFFGSHARGGGYKPRGSRGWFSRVLFGKASYVWSGKHVSG